MLSVWPLKEKFANLSGRDWGETIEYIEIAGMEKMGRIANSNSVTGL